MKKQLSNGAKWGDWTLDSKDLFLVLEAKEGGYEFSLENIRNSASMLDWIFQLRVKAWMTNEIIGDLLSAFQDIFAPQESLCGDGIDKELDTASFLKNRIKGVE